MKYRYEVIEREACYRGFFTVNRCRIRHELYRGGWGEPIERELLERGHAVALVPYDPVLDQVVLVEQFRVGALDAPGGPWMVEFIAGIIEPEEELEGVVVREAEEEAGLELLALEPISEFVLSPGGCSERITLYCARVDARGAGGCFGLAEEGEDIRAWAADRAEAVALLDSDRVLSATTVVGLQWLALNHEVVRERWLAREPTR